VAERETAILLALLVRNGPHDCLNLHGFSF
jgi:hypothetical protein